MISRKMIRFVDNYQDDHDQEIRVLTMRIIIAMGNGTYSFRLGIRKRVCQMDTGRSPSDRKSQWSPWTS